MHQAAARRFVFLLGTDNPAVVPVVESALRAAGIPFESGLQSEPGPRVVFTVPAEELVTARAVVEQVFGAGPLATDDEAGRPRSPSEPEEAGEEPARFPWGPVQAVAALVTLHAGWLVALVGRDPNAARLSRAGGLIAGAGASQAWRLVSHLFVHSDPSHVFWNGLSTLVFAVPVIERLGYARAGALYVASGIAGGVAALSTSDPGTVTVGSSGAVAGLFGAWLVRTIRDSRRSPLTRRARIRAVGVGLLYLPSLLTPTTLDGHRVSVAAHLGGLAAGVILGWMLRGTRR